MAASSNKYSFRRIHMLTLFCIRTNLRENRFFAAKCGLVIRKGTYNVKFFTKNITTVDKLTSWWAQPSFHSFKLTRWPVNELTSWWRSHLSTFSPFHPFTLSPLKSHLSKIPRNNDCIKVNYLLILHPKINKRIKRNHSSTVFTDIIYLTNKGFCH